MEKIQLKTVKILKLRVDVDQNGIVDNTVLIHGYNSAAVFAVGYITEECQLR